MDENVTILIKQIVNNPSVSGALRRKVLNALDPKTVGIFWSTEDVEYLAKKLEEDEGKEVGSMYDRSMFHEMLSDLCEQTEYGVSWTSIEDNLVFCLIEDEG